MQIFALISFGVFVAVSLVVGFRLLRLALREAGLKPDSLTTEQVRAVLQHILPAQLQ